MARTLAADVRARLALGWQARATAGAELGEFTLRPSQLEAVAMIQRAFAEFGGALLADPPGTGKTVIALAVARGARDVLCAAPATLRAQWELAARRARVPLRFVSLERLSQGATVARAGLVIVDEAHQARTPGTRRYAQLAALTVGAKVLLLTATPVVNSVQDRSALLALFLGARTESLDARTLARVILRREQQHAPMPLLRRSTPLAVASDRPEIAESLRALPPPLPAADGRAALALIQLTLAMAWTSSLAALDFALRRRTQRGESLADALREGRWPSRAALRDWVIGDDATQLAMPLLLVPPSAAPPLEGLPTLELHLRAVQALRRLIKPWIAPDTARRADGVRELARLHVRSRIAVFAQHAATIHALYAELRNEPGVVAFTGSGVRSAGGRLPRREVLQALGPGAPPLRADDPRAIRVLLTTDILSEGVEMPGIGIVVHGDAAWTPARLEQRVGRAARVGGGREVLVTRFELPRAAAPWLALGARLRRKARSRIEALKPATVDERLGSLLRSWLPVSSADMPSPAGRVASVVAARRGFLAAVGIADETFLLAGRLTSNGWRISDRPARVLALCRRAEGEAIQHAAASEADARRAIARWVRRRVGRSTVGVGARLESRTLRALRRRLNALIAGAPLAARAAIAAECTHLLGIIARSGGEGISRALRNGCARASTSEALLTALRELAADIERTPPDAAPPTQQRLRLYALLLLVPADEGRGGPTGRGEP